MKHLFFLVLLLFAMSLAAIDSIPGSGEQVIPPDGRDYTFAYHNGTDDYRFYGSDKWAVRFDFAAEYPAQDSVVFAIDKALLYFPQTGDSVRIELFNEVAGLPGQRLALADAGVTQNNMQIDLPVVAQANVVWLIVSYSTNFINRYVSASAGGGTHSYYLNYNAQNPYFQSFANAGFNCELLFGLGGSFQFDTPDLALTSFGFSGVIAPREDIYPAFSIYNHSDQSINNARVELLITSPLAEFSIADTIWVMEQIPPRSLYVYNSQSIGYFEHRLTLHDSPMQIRIRAVLKSELTVSGSDPTFNNNIIKYMRSFAHEYPAYLVENFLRQDNAAQILNVQDQYTLPTLSVINYFPVLGDSLANLAASQRYHWYGFNSFPRTVMNGTLRINGYSSTYQDQYQALSALATQSRTFISSSDCRFVASSTQDFLTATITLSNTDTHLYNTTTDLNLITGGSFFVALFKKNALGGASRYVIERWISHAEALSGSLNHSQILELSYNISLANIDINTLAANYRVYYWYQLNGGGDILFSDYADFDTIVSNDDEYLPPPSLTIYPNPLRGDGMATIQIDTARSMRDLAYSVYNLRGQKLFSERIEGSPFTIPATPFPASGVYLIRVSYSDELGQREIRRKISIIK